MSELVRIYNRQTCFTWEVCVTTIKSPNRLCIPPPPPPHPPFVTDQWAQLWLTHKRLEMGSVNPCAADLSIFLEWSQHAPLAPVRKSVHRFRLAYGTGVRTPGKCMHSSTQLHRPSPAANCHQGTGSVKSGFVCALLEKDLNPKFGIRFNSVFLETNEKLLCRAE